VICLACRYLSIPLETFFRGLRGPFPSHHNGDETDEDDETDADDDFNLEVVEAWSKLGDVEDGDNAKQAVENDAGQGSELSGDEDEPLCRLSGSEYENVTAKVLQARLKHAGASAKGKKTQLFKTWKALPAIKQLQSIQAEFKTPDCAVLPGDVPALLMLLCC
jgi:hypothetical protein